MRVLRALPVALLAVGLLSWGCSLPEDQPSEPDPIPEGPSTVTAPGPNPGVTPTPGLGSPASTPTPGSEDSPDDPEGDDPTDDPTPEPSGPPPTSGCGAPVPPEIRTFNVKIHLRGPESWTLDSTPLVGPDEAYCRQIGFTDGRSFCPVRPEGHPEREACETLAVGYAEDTGRPGPTWRKDGSFCLGRPSCENHPDNQYFVKAFGGGNYAACARNGACGTFDVAR